MPTLVDVPLQQRVDGARQVITTDTTTTATQRCVVLAFAIWPNAIETPACPPRLRCYPPEVRQQALDLAATGMSSSQISKVIGVPAATIKQWRRTAKGG